MNLIKSWRSWKWFEI